MARAYFLRVAHLAVLRDPKMASCISSIESWFLWRCAPLYLRSAIILERIEDGMARY
jgi:hypothetical protein